jgi:hypothetical protein
MLSTCGSSAWKKWRKFHLAPSSGWIYMRTLKRATRYAKTMTEEEWMVETLREVYALADRISPDSPESRRRLDEVDAAVAALEAS